MCAMAKKGRGARQASKHVRTMDCHDSLAFIGRRFATSSPGSVVNMPTASFSQVCLRVFEAQLEHSVVCRSY